MSATDAVAEHGLVRRIAAFSVPPLVSMVAPLLVLPLVARQASTAEWAALAVGQALGAVLGIVVAFGWPLVGPVEIARSTSRTGAVFYESLVTRLTLLAVSTPVLVVLAWPAAPPGEATLTALTAAATATMGLSSQWVAVGLGRAGPVTALEHLPRLVVMVIAGTLVAGGGSVFLYPVAIAASSLLGLVLFAVLAVRPVRSGRSGVRVLRSRLVDQWPAGMTTLMAGAYSAGALFVVGLAAEVDETAELSSADRLFRVGLVSVTVLASALQAWVVPHDPTTARRRRRQAVLLHAGLGLLGAMVFTVAAPPVARLLFGETLGFGRAVAAGYGVAFLFIALGTSLAQHILVPAGQVRSTLAATLVGALVGVPLLLVLSATEGAEGGAAGLALSELLVLAVLAWRARLHVVDRSPQGEW